jgi:hypothetical protein
MTVRIHELMIEVVNKGVSMVGKKNMNRKPVVAWISSVSMPRRRGMKSFYINVAESQRWANNS